MVFWTDRDQCHSVVAETIVNPFVQMKLAFDRGRENLFQSGVLLNALDMLNDIAANIVRMMDMFCRCDVFEFGT